MSANWTEAQNKVIEHKNGNLLVSASAGSGKTSVIIEKIVSLIMSGSLHLKNILAVTFTNSASLEIKQRLEKSLKEAGKKELLLELEDLSTSDILTFDGFCIKVVREFGYEIGQNNNFSVADNALSGFLKNQALDNLLSQKSKILDENFTNVLDTFFDSRNDSAFRSGIISLYEFLNNKSDKEFYRQKLKDNFQLDDINKNDAIKYLNEFLLSIKNNFLKELLSLQIESQNLNDVKVKMAIDLAVNDIARFGEDFFENLNVAKTGIEYNMPKTLQNDSEQTKDIKQRFLVAKNNFKNQLKFVFDKDILNFSIDQIKEDLKATQKRLEYLLNFANEFEEEYAKLKKSLQVLDFLDIEKCAKQILENSKIANAVKSRYDWIFIDEYQDTSLLQESIVKRITTNNNLLMVGDFKQSIYRFRQAEPKIFISKYNNFKNNLEQGNVIELKTNFRSENAILQFNNFVFDHIYKKEIDDFEYNGNADLEFGGFSKTTSKEPKVNLFLINDEVDEKNEEKQNPSFENVYSVKDSELIFGGIEKIEKEALVVLDEITKLLKKNYFDAKSQTEKQITFSDIAILSRGKNSAIPYIKKIFNKAGIPVTAVFDEVLLENYDMQILLSIVKTIQNSQSDIDLISALTNIGHISFDELSTIRYHFRDEEFFYQAVNKYIENIEDELSQKLKAFFEKIKKYQIYALHSNICELLLKINESENLETYFSLNDYGSEYKNHLTLLIENLASVKDYSLFEFVNYIDNFGSELKFETTIKDSENSVTLSTIHKSKGLEYPVVFLVGTGKEFNFEDLKEKILRDNDFGIAMKSYNLRSHNVYENIIFNSFKQKIKNEIKKEEKRLLYVALTRAKNYLYITGNVKENAINHIESTFDINNATSYLKWILGCFSEKELEKLKSDLHIQKYLINKFDGKVLNSKIDVKLISQNQLSFDIEKIKLQNDSNSIESKDNFVEILSQKFDKNNLSKKNSVTQLVSEEEHYNITDFDYRKTDKFDDQDFLKIGKAYHKYMELIDFSFNETYIKNQIQNLKDEKKLSIEESILVDETKIIKAIKTLKGLVDFADIVYKEKQFLAYMPAKNLIKTENQTKILVQGVADLIIEKENSIILVDYKTSRISEKSFKDKYATQLNIYQRAIESFYKKPVAKKVIYSFYLGKMIEI